MNWTYTVLLICLLLAVFAVWREVQRDNKKHLAIRVVAVLLAIAGLACIILPITYESDISIDDKSSAVLLTDGYHADSIGAYTRIYTFSKKIKKAYPKAVLVGSPQDILNAKPVITNLQVFGYGLDQDALSQLNKLPIKFHAAIAPLGISTIGWNQQLKTGEKLHVQGSLNNTSAQSVEVILKGLGTTLDSVIIPTKTNFHFNLSTTPRHAGKAVYRLITVTNNTDTLANESIPVQVDAVKPLKVLVLAGAPDFENKFLKNWLAANGYGVAVRSMISKDKYSQEFANVPEESLGHLTPALLDKFDVVVGDLDVLKNLNPAEGSALKQQVLQKGTGIIVRADSTTHSAFWLQQNFPLNRVSTVGQLITGLKIQGQNNNTSKLLLDPVYISYQNYTQPLVADPQNRVVASSGLAGSGREIFTTLSNTHSWMLSGNENDYTALWALLITKAAKHTPAAEQWSVVSEVPVVNRHTRIQLETSAQQPEIAINRLKTAAVGQPALPFAYTADYWPDRTGWQLVQQGTGTPQWWYAYPQNEWMGMKYSKMIKETRSYAAAFDNGSSVTKQIHQKMRIPVSKIYFYILLLAACTYLWAEAKFTT